MLVKIVIWIMLLFKFNNCCFNFKFKLFGFVVIVW